MAPPGLVVRSTTGPERLAPAVAGVLLTAGRRLILDRLTGSPAHRLTGSTGSTGSTGELLARVGCARRR